MSDEHDEHDEHGHGEHGHEDGAAFRQAVIVTILVGAVLLLHRFGDAGGSDQFDPTAMLALGFVVLASFTIGHLGELAKLPHITGYLLAGMFFGPSIGGLVEHYVHVSLWVPFNEGVLNDAIITQLSPLETLAVALIAITAGGELKIETLKSGLRAILSILVVQLILVLGAIVGLFYVMSGAFPALTLPGLGEIGREAVIPIGLMLGAIGFATSPAATIAVINETGSKGPMSRTVLSTVVLKDVFVIVLFGIFSALALQALGGSSDGNLASDLFIHIFGSILAGVVLGLGLVVYLRFVNAELMLFIAGTVYLGSFLSTELHLDSVLVFLVAGFTVSNFSRHGDTLIHTVERLSMPVYVVFFTLAGAKLHLHEVIGAFAFALALVLTRMTAIYLGVRVGSWIGRADPATKKHGWMGFVSQAGVAITLAQFVRRDFGAPGEALSNLLIAGVALNEIIGPIALKVGLGWAGETREKKAEAASTEELPEEVAEVAIEPWPEPVEDVEWGPRLKGALGRQIQELEHDLKAVVRDVGMGPMDAFREDVEKFFREVRRDFLRMHRRLLVAARTLPENPEDRAKARLEIARRLRSEQNELAERWRAVVLARVAQLGKEAPWTPEEIVASLDDAVDALVQTVEVPWSPRSFEPRDDDGRWQSMQRSWLRMRRGTRKIFGRDLPPRTLPLRDLARFHLNFETPPRLEGVAALFVAAEQQVAGRTRLIFDTIVRTYDDLARATVGDEEIDLVDALTMVRADIEVELDLASREVEHIARDGALRTARILSRGLRDVKDESAIYGTFDLPERARRSSRGLRERVQALELLTETLTRLRRSSGGELALLAMELELVGLEAQVKEARAEHVTRLEGEVQRRAVQQCERVAEQVRNASTQMLEALEKVQDRDELAAVLHDTAGATEKVAGEAGRIVRELRDELLDDQKFAHLLEALEEAALHLTPHYEVSAGRLQRGEFKLPPVVERVDVPFREMVVARIETRIAPDLFKSARAMADKLQPLAASLTETEHLIAFNDDLVRAELDSLMDSSIPSETRELLRELLSTQLERSKGLLADYLEQASSWPRELGQSIVDAMEGGVRELRVELVEGQITRAKVEEMRRQAQRRRLAQRAGQLPSLLKDARRELGEAITSLVGPARLELWRRFLGLPVPKSALRLEPSTFAPAQSEAANLPLVYRRLFAGDAMDAGDVLTGREPTIERVRRALEESAPGTRRGVALIGLEGVGKSSVASAAVRSGRWRRVRRVEFTEPPTVEDVVEQLGAITDAQLVVVEGLHWLLSARPDGLSPLRRFVDEVVADGGKRAWLVVAESLFWEYAASVAPLEEAFPTQVHLEPLGLEELRAAVMARHRLSGYGHSFERIESESRIEGLVARGASRIRRPFDQYFHDLHLASGGVLRDALRLWLASIRGVQEDEIVHVGRVPESGFASLSRLPEEELLSVFQIARQGWMDAPTFASVFRIAEGEASARLAKLAHLGLLEEREGRHRIAHHLRGTAVRVLRHRGWV